MEGVGPIFEGVGNRDKRGPHLHHQGRQRLSTRHSHQVAIETRDWTPPTIL